MVPSSRRGVAEGRHFPWTEPGSALSGDREAAACAARLLRQASFIASSIHNKSSVEWREGVGWLVRAVCTPDSSEEGEDDGGGSSGLARGGVPTYAHVLEETGGCGCWECDDRAGAGRPNSARLGAPDRDGGPPAAPGHTVAAAAGSIDEGQVTVTLRSRGTPATWIFPGEHWWPPPRVGHPWEANVKWQVDTCGRCRHERAFLVAAGPIGQGSELCAETGYPGQVYLPDEAALHLAMDDSAKGRTASAGAVLWGRGGLGRWRRIAEAFISIGSETSPTCAEAWAVRGRRSSLGLRRVGGEGAHQR